jgi:Cupin-like domain
MIDLITADLDTLCKTLTRELITGLTGHSGDEEICQVSVFSEAGSAQTNLLLSRTGVVVLESPQRKPAVSVSFPRELIQNLLGHLETNGSVLLKIGVGNGVQVDGSERLCNLLLGALKRPSAALRAHYDETEVQAVQGPQRTSIAYIERHKGLAGISSELNWTLAQAFEQSVAEALASGQPVKLNNASEGMSLDKLNQLIGHYKDPELPTSMHDFIEQARAQQGEGVNYSSGVYLPQTVSDDLKLSLVTSLTASGRIHFGSPLLWAGISIPERMVTGLHRDPEARLLVQLIGRKRFLLYSPAESDNVYPSSSYDYYQPCWVSPVAPRYDAHPKYANAHGCELELSEGEAMILPDGWFHAAFIDDLSFSLAYPIALAEGRHSSPVDHFRMRKLREL